MKTAIRSFAMLIALSGGINTGDDGREVEIVLSGGGTVRGEVLSVRESTIVVTRHAGAAEGELALGAKPFQLLRHQEIVSIRTRGTSHTVVGLFSGMAIGCLAGYAIGVNQPVSQHREDVFGCGSAAEAGERSANGATGALAGTLGGAAVGLAIGASIRSDQEVLISPSQRNFAAVKFVARYPEVEPVFIRTMLP